jgi:hypothetical protein
MPEDNTTTQREILYALRRSTGGTNTAHTGGPQQVEWMVIAADKETLTCLLSDLNCLDETNAMFPLTGPHLVFQVLTQDADNGVVAKAVIISYDGCSRKVCSYDGTADDQEGGSLSRLPKANEIRNAFMIVCKGRSYKKKDPWHETEGIRETRRFG